MSAYDEREKYQEGQPATPDNMPSDVIISPDTRRERRIPPGQTRTRKWPVLHYGRVPEISLDRWKLDIIGLVDSPASYSWEEFRALPRVKVFSDFHCVTRWSRLGNIWDGVSAGEIFKRCSVQPDAKFVIAKGYDDGWTTNLPIEAFLQKDVLLVDTHDGQSLSAEHGGPVRLMVPSLYAWKSAKWIRSIEFTAKDCPGYWEQAGYHNHGDPWIEERFGS